MISLYISVVIDPICTKYYTNTNLIFHIFINLLKPMTPKVHWMLTAKSDWMSRPGQTSSVCVTIFIFSERPTQICKMWTFDTRMADGRAGGILQARDKLTSFALFYAIIEKPGYCPNDFTIATRNISFLFSNYWICILIFNSLSRGNSKQNDSITRIFWLEAFLFLFMRIIWMRLCIKSLIYALLLNGELTAEPDLKLKADVTLLVHSCSCTRQQAGSWLELWWPSGGQYENLSALLCMH